MEETIGQNLPLLQYLIIYFAELIKVSSVSTSNCLFSMMTDTYIPTRYMKYQKGHMILMNIIKVKISMLANGNNYIFTCQCIN